jgi:hypothetical protein
MEVSGHLHDPVVLSPEKLPPDTHWIGGWMCPTAGLDAVKKRKFLLLQGIEPSPSSM